MVDVSPFTQRIPDELLSNQNTRIFFEELLEHLYLLWERSGGGEDIIQNIEVNQVIENTQIKGINRLKQDLKNLEDRISEIPINHQKKDNKEIFEYIDLVTRNPIQRKPEEMVEKYTPKDRRVEELQNTIDTMRLFTFNLEKKLKELEERIDSGV